MNSLDFLKNTAKEKKVNRRFMLFPALFHDTN